MTNFHVTDDSTTLSTDGTKVYIKSWSSHCEWGDSTLPVTAPVSHFEEGSVSVVSAFNFVCSLYVGWLFCPDGLYPLAEAEGREWKCEAGGKVTDET